MADRCACFRRWVVYAYSKVVKSHKKSAAAVSAGQRIKVLGANWPT